MEEEKTIENEAGEQKDVIVYNLQPHNCTMEMIYTFKINKQEDT
jgi:hypothetical protein